MTTKPQRVVLITGAAGGLGSVIARRFADEGYGLVLTDIRPLDDLADRLGDSVLFHASCDLGVEQEIVDFTQQAQAVTSIDILVNNAAYLPPVRFADLEPAQFRTFLKINVEAPFVLTKLLTAGMIDRGWGRVINVVTGSAWAPPLGFVGYVTSKMGMVGFTRALSHELGNLGVTVNAITPGLVIHEATRDALPESVSLGIQQRQAIQRPSTPQDFVGAIAFLASDDAAFMTGQTIAVDGGFIHL